MILTKATDKEVKAETISRIKTLIDKYNLNPNVLKYFRKGQVYYSYLTAMGMMGSIDTISYDEDYEKAVKDFEVHHKGYVVYHAIESITPQQRLVEKEDKEIEVMIMQADYALEKFKNGGSETMSGTVKWFNTQKGYGFITGDDGAEYFAHQTQIKMDGFRTLDAGDIVEFDVRSEEKGLAAVNIVPVLTLSMMKKKAAKEHLHLDVAPADGSGNANWMIVDGNNFIVAGEQGMSLEELDEYFTE